MPRAANGSIELEYETFGSADDPTVICLPGMGNQLLLFASDLCEAFVDRGFHVIRMDNRDAGLSSATSDDDHYTLDDMADDVVAVLDHADVADAVVLGVSLGGMVAQATAIRHPHRVRALVSIGSTTGEPHVGHATPEALAALSRPQAPSRVEQVESDLAGRRLWSNPDWFDEDRMRVYFTALYERAWVVGGADRQLAAVVRSGSRVEGLASLAVPTLVVHGGADTLIDPSGGRRTAELVPGADYLEIEEMSHDFVAQMWPPLVDAVTALTARTFEA